MTAENAGDGDTEGTCEHLRYREHGGEGEGSGDPQFETARAYCTVVDEFVQPVRADVCNARYDLSPAEHCEYYREQEGIEDPWLTGAATGEQGEDAGNPEDGS